MKDKAREVCIYRISNNGIIKPKMYYKDAPHEYCNNDWLSVLSFVLVCFCIISFVLLKVSLTVFLLVVIPLVCITAFCIALQQRIYQDSWNELYLKTKTPEQKKLREDYLAQRENQIATLETLKNTPIGKLTSVQKERMEELSYKIKYEEYR